MIVWIWDASGPAADACGVTGTAEAARRAVGLLLSSGRADAAHLEQAALVIGRTLSYDYCPQVAPGMPGWNPASPSGSPLIRQQPTRQSRTRQVTDIDRLRRIPVMAAQGR